MRVLLLLFCFYCPAELLSQKLGERSVYEKHWAFFHPFAALKVKKIYRECLPLYKDLKNINEPDAFENGGKLDAFRHIFFMAAFSQKVKIRTLRKLGIAHEKGNHLNFLNNIKEDGEFADSLSNVMDLKNNELGFRIGKEFRKTDLKELKNIVTESIKKGEAVCFKRNASGGYLTCDGIEINLSDYKGQWFIPKCLIPTNL